MNASRRSGRATPGRFVVFGYVPASIPPVIVPPVSAVGLPHGIAAVGGVAAIISVTIGPPVVAINWRRQGRWIGIGRDRVAISVGRVSVARVTATVISVLIAVLIAPADGIARDGSDHASNDRSDGGVIVMVVMMVMATIMVR
jgi:hypothetical protein